MTNPAHNFYVLVITWHPPECYHEVNGLSEAGTIKQSHSGCLALGVRHGLGWNCLGNRRRQLLSATYRNELRNVVLERSLEVIQSPYLLSFDTGGTWKLGCKVTCPRSHRMEIQTSKSQIKVCLLGNAVFTVRQGSSSELQEAQKKQSPSEAIRGELKDSPLHPPPGFADEEMESLLPVKPVPKPDKKYCLLTRQQGAWHDWAPHKEGDLFKKYLQFLVQRYLKTFTKFYFCATVGYI